MPNSSQHSQRDCDRVVPNDLKAELEICNFYITVIKEMYKSYNPTFEDILKSLPTVRNYKFGIPSDGVPFNESINRFVYIYEYSFIHSVLMYDRFSDFLKCNPILLNKLNILPEVRLCLLGGGAGFEAISVIKIFNILRKKSNLKSSPLSLNITVIDACGGWEKDAELIISSASRDMLSSSNIIIDLQFIAADLTSDFCESVKSALKKSHIVTMCKFLSDVSDSSYDKSKIHELLERVIECMSFEACLFFLDNGGSSTFKKIDKMIDEHADTLSIYKGGPFSRHILSLDSVETISKSLKDIFLYLKCTSQTITSCSAWLKINYNESDPRVDAISPFNEVELKNKLKNKGRKMKVKKTYQSGSGPKSEIFLTVTDWRIPK